jgi:SNF2 family DNA or RNA helicase
MTCTLTRTDEALELDLSTCRGGEFMDTLAKIKEIPGRRYEGDRKIWLVPNDVQTAERVLYALQPKCSHELVEWVRSGRQEAEANLVSPLPEDGVINIPWAIERAPWQPETVNSEPFIGLKAHQRALIQGLVTEAVSDKVMSAIVADDMGLGKTGSAISAVSEYAQRFGHGSVIQLDDDDARLRYYTGDRPRLIVCPNSVKGVWGREIERWLGPDEPVQLIDGSSAKARHNQLTGALNGPTWVVVNYEQLRTTKIKKKTRTGGTKTIEAMKEPLFETTPWFAVLADEAHRAKNRRASQTRGLFRVKGDIMLALTGTPLMNSPDELWALLRWLYPKEYTSYWRFFEQYVEYIEGHFGKVITGVKNQDALRFELHGRLYRRTKAQVLDLPEKQRITIPVELSAKARKLYNECETGLWLEIEKAIEEGDSTAARLAEAATTGKNVYAIPNGAARLVRLRQILSNPALLGGEDSSDKMDAVVDRITDNAHRQHIIFSEFVGSCSILAERLRANKLRVETYTGETVQHRRTELEDEFQREEIDVLVGTIGAMREGITLTSGSVQHWLERSWVPGWNEQGEDRQHRIGQRNDVTIYIYEGHETVDDGKIAPTNRLKEGIVKSVIPKDKIKESR